MKHVLALLALALFCDYLLHADDASYHASRRHEARVIVQGKPYSHAEIARIADAEPRMRDLKHMSRACRAVLMAKADSHPESVDWLTFVTR